MTKDALNTSFTVNVLFSEPLEFDFAEITQAVKEDYPAFRVTDMGVAPGPQRTDSMVLGVLTPADTVNGGVISFTTPGSTDAEWQNADHTETLFHSANFPGAETAIRKHQSYIAISITSDDDSLASRFRALRQLSCVVAVFAKLPITMGIYCCWSNRVTSPDQWVEDTKTAENGEWPYLSWVSFRAGWDQSRAGNSYAGGRTIGLSAFCGWEIFHAAAPMQPSDVAAMLATATYMRLGGGHTFGDGHTVGGDDGSVAYRVRYFPFNEGDPFRQMALIHKDSPLDEEAEFGPRPGIAPVDRTKHMTKTNKNFLRNLLAPH